MSGPAFDIVVPTLGRPSLPTLLATLARARGPRPGRVLLVDDRRDARTPLATLPVEQRGGLELGVLRGRAAGPAAARNIGWRASSADWIAFLDDDVVPDGAWLEDLAADLAFLPPVVGGSQGRIRVPRPIGRRSTDWERNVAGLETARWPTADMAYRRAALAAVSGFDERFRRAYREDADLALRVQAKGYRLVEGRRVVLHPARSVDRWVSVRVQAGNGDDVLMRARHGRAWRTRAGVGRGRRPRHLAIAAAAALAVMAGIAGKRRLMALGALAWLGGTAELTWARIAPGPRTVDEVATMVATSLAIPLVASYHYLAGHVRWFAANHRLRWFVANRRLRWFAANQRLRCVVSTYAPAGVRRPRAVLLDRDGTLVVDVPYNKDPDLVRPVPGAREALDRLRTAGIAVAVVSNQSGVGRGLLTEEHVAAVNARIEALLGPMAAWLICPHAPSDGCRCRKPAPGLITDAAARLGVVPGDCVVIGDIGADVEAARRAGARGILVPTGVTRATEILASPEVARDLPAAVSLILGANAGTAIARAERA